MDDLIFLLIVGLITLLIVVIVVAYYILWSPARSSGNYVLDALAKYNNWGDHSRNPTAPYSFQLNSSGMLITYIFNTGYLGGITQLQAAYTSPNPNTVQAVVTDVVKNPSLVSQPQHWTFTYVNSTTLHISNEQYSTTINVS